MDNFPFERPNIVTFNENSCETEFEFVEIHNNHKLTYEEIYLSLGFDLPAQTELAEIISRILEQIISVNENKPHKKTIFDSKKVPGITVPNYMQRIVKHGRLSLETLIICIIYLDRLNEADEEFFINKYNVHKWVK